LGTLWNQVKSEVAPWWREVSMHAFRSGIVDAAAALENWSKSRSGERVGRRVGFPRFKKRDKTVESVSFVEINHQLSWLHENRHAIRLMLPQSTPDPDVKRRRSELSWLHTTVSTRRLYRLVEEVRAHRRARLHGHITKTRALHLHHLTNALAGGFDLVAIEDLNIAGMSTRKRRLGRALADASLGELRRQLTYKTSDRDSVLVPVDRFYPSSKTCSSCTTVKAKLALHERVFNCDNPACKMTLDRDINAARNIASEAERLHRQQQVIAGLRPEIENATPRPHKTRPAHAGLAAVA
ncbi:MAG: RNA-guided endonuclease TnpB family protein, partial [Ilumatobacteraceae bacterium]